MRKNNIKLKSLVLAVLYFVTTNIYFFEGAHNPISESLLQQSFEKIGTLPAIIIWGVGLRYGLFSMIFSAIIIFLIIWSITLGLTYTYYLIKNEMNKKKPTA